MVVVEVYLAVLVVVLVVVVVLAFVGDSVPAAAVAVAAVVEYNQVAADVAGFYVVDFLAAIDGIVVGVASHVLEIYAPVFLFSF